MRTAQDWIKVLLENLEEKLDEETRVKILENAGRKCCISGGYYKKAQECMNKSKNVEEFLENMERDLTILQRDGGNIYLVYERCYCPVGRALLKEYPKGLRTFCNCSIGWVKQMFESALKSPVRVELEKSVLRGDDACRFRVLL